MIVYPSFRTNEPWNPRGIELCTSALATRAIVLASMTASTDDLGVLRRSDRQQHTVIFTVACRPRDEERFTVYMCVIAERRRPARLDVHFDDGRGIRAAGPIAVGRPIREAIRTPGDALVVG